MQYTDITSRALTYLLRSPYLHIDMTEAIYRDWQRSAAPSRTECCCACAPPGMGAPSSMSAPPPPQSGAPPCWNSWNPMSHWSLTRNTRRPNIKPCIPASPNAVCKASGPPLRRQHGIRRWRSGRWI